MSAPPATPIVYKPQKGEVLPMCQVRIITLGIGNLGKVASFLLKERFDEELKQDLHTLLGQANNHIIPADEAAIIRVLAKLPGVLGINRTEHDIICFDQRKANDPEHGVHKCHLGSHPVNLEAFSRTACCKENLMAVRQAVWSRFVNDPNRRSWLTVVSYCRGGVHRGPAFGKLLGHVCRRDAGYNSKHQMPLKIEIESTDEIHLSQLAGFWQKPHRCKECSECRHSNLSREHTKLRDQAFDRAFNLWVTGEL